MKLTLLKVLVLFFLVSTAMAGAFLDFFHGWSESENVKLEWKTGEENNIQHFVVERKSPQSSYTALATIQPLGSNKLYTYVDENAYKTSDLVFTYRLKIVELNGQSNYSTEVTISHNISGVKRTWGSIKAMFR
jgi:hypothetical protein